MSTRKPSPGPLPDRVWWVTDASPITQAWECPQPVSDPPPAVPAHTADGWQRAARPHACAPVSHSCSLSQRVHPSQPPPLRSAYSVTRVFASVSSAALIAFEAGPPSSSPRRAGCPSPGPQQVCACRAGRPPAGRGGLWRAGAAGAGSRERGVGTGRAVGRHRQVCREKWPREKWLYISCTPSTYDLSEGAGVCCSTYSRKTRLMYV
jgi:hypothetical protein